MVAAGFEPLALGLLVPLGIAGFLWSVTGDSWRATTSSGVAFGLGFMGVLLSWLWPSIGPGAWAILVLVQSGWFVLAALGIRAVWAQPGAPLWAAGWWVLIELARSSWPFGGFPWGRIGFAAVDTSWAGLLPYVGVTGTGLLVVLVPALLLHTIQQPRSRGFPATSGVLGVILLPALVPYDVTSSAETMVSVVQGDVPGRGNELAANHRAVTRNHVAATKDLAVRVDAGVAPRPDFVVWPENSTAVDPIRDPQARAGIETAVDAIGVPLLVGGVVDAPDPNEAYNQGVVWEPEGLTAQRYTKHHPVPFGEYIPFRRFLEDLSDRFDKIPRDMLPGSGSQPLQLAGIPVADAICFDVAYDDVVAPQVRAGAQIVVVQTSNATFTETTQLAQQFTITRARALESGRSVAVASTNGISALILPNGDVLQRAPVRETVVLTGALPLVSEVTPAVRWSAAMRIASGGVGVAGLAIAGVCGWRRRTRATTT